MMPGQGSEFGGQGESEQKILGGKLFFELAFQPLLALMMLAVGTAAMATGVRHPALVGTLGTVRQHQGALRSATDLQGGQGLAMARQDRALVVFQEGGFEGLNNRREPDHLTVPQSMEKLFMRSLIRWRA
jgi:hypothetical protein